MARRVLKQLRPAIVPGVSALVAILATAAGTLGDRTGLTARWMAELAPPAGVAGPTGHATFEPGRRAGEVKVRLILSNDTPGAQRTWRVRDTRGAVLGATAAVRINAKGNGVAVLTLTGDLPAPPDLVIEVHADETLVASGAILG